MGAPDWATEWATSRTGVAFLREAAHVDGLARGPSDLGGRAVEVLFVGVGSGARPVHDAVAMVGR